MGPAVLSDMDYLKSKVRRHASNGPDDSEADDNENASINNEIVPKKSTKRGSAAAEAVDSEVIFQSTPKVSEGGSDIQLSLLEEDTSRLFVKNLPFSCSEDEFRSLVERFGPVEVHLPLDVDKKGKGYGFADFMLPDHAVQAYLVRHSKGGCCM